MKKIFYEHGPDEIRVGPVNNQVLLKRGEPTPVDDKIAESLLKKPMFKEFTEKKSNREGAKDAKV